MAASIAMLAWLNTGPREKSMSVTSAASSHWAPVAPLVDVQQRVVPEVGRRAQGAAAARERRAAHRKQFLGAQPGDVQAGPMSVAVTDRQIDIFARKIDVLKRRGHPQVDGRMLFREPPEPVHQPFAGKVGRRAHRQRPGIVPLQQIFGPQRQAVECIAHHPEIGLPGRRDDETAMFAVEQPAAQFGFQRLDLVADGALRHAEFLRRLGEALVPRRGLKSLQGVERWQSAGHGQPLIHEKN